MRTCWFIVVESMGSWWIDCEGKAYGPFESSLEARSEAQRVAATYGDPDRIALIFAPGEDGRQELVWSEGEAELDYSPT